MVHRESSQPASKSFPYVVAASSEKPGIAQRRVLNDAGKIVFICTLIVVDRVHAFHFHGLADVIFRGSHHVIDFGIDHRAGKRGQALVECYPCESFTLFTVVL